MLLWDEFQRKEEYKQRDLAIRSCVLALFERSKIPASPLVLSQPGEPPGQVVERIRFSYEVIELWKIPSQRLLDLQHLALYPLLPLTEGGATREIISMMLDRLPGEQNRDFAAIGVAFAAFRLRMLKREHDIEWLQERLHMNDIIRESPFYQWALEEGIVKGREEGIVKGREEGITQMRQAVVDFIQEHFPELAQLAQEVVTTIDNPAQLVRLSAKIGGAQSVERARLVLLALAQ